MQFAICNEIFPDLTLTDQFDVIASSGYEAVELAPLTLPKPVEALTPADRRAVRASAEARGLTISGLHWLLARVPGVHVASPDDSIRARTVHYLTALSRLCHDLGGRVLVFGSPAQRSTPLGMDPARAHDLAVGTFRAWATRTSDLDVTICLESLPAEETDFMTTVADAVAVAAEVDRDNVRIVLDVKSMSAEGRPIDGLIRSARNYVAYIQANDANRGGPGFGHTDFVPIFSALRDIGYDGFVSVEAFDVSPGAERVARESNAYLRQCAARAGLHLTA
jgi:D-psicose/D-tagatose/L-ribulose 3-epimerase